MVFVGFGRGSITVCISRLDAVYVLYSARAIELHDVARHETRIGVGPTAREDHGAVSGHIRGPLDLELGASELHARDGADDESSRFTTATRAELVVNADLV